MINVRRDKDFANIGVSSIISSELQQAYVNVKVSGRKTITITSIITYKSSSIDGDKQVQVLLFNGDEGFKKSR